jgi:orotate phosphoribosyltransferase
MSWDVLRLRALIKMRAYKEGDFTLSSGKKSKFYFDGKAIILEAEGALLFSRWIFQGMNDLKRTPVAIGGIEIGAIPIATAVMMLWATNNPLPMSTFIVRKTSKDHGTGNKVEGSLRAGDPVVVVEDVITTGESTMKAIRAVEEIGCNVIGIYALVDRQESHIPEFEARKDIFKPMFVISDFSTHEQPA